MRVALLSFQACHLPRLLRRSSQAHAPSVPSRHRNCCRVRPFSDVEVEARCRVATTKPPGEPQITLGQNKSFTFDEVYFMDSEQAPIFAETVQPLIDGSVSRYYCYLENGINPWLCMAPVI